MKLGEIAEIRTGLVLARKKASSLKDVCKTYKLLTLKSFDNIGKLNEEHLDDFQSVQKLDRQYLTNKGDIIIRLSNPNTALCIDESQEGYVIPSLFSIIRLKNIEFLPEYITWYLNSDFVKKEIAKSQIGSAIPIIKNNFLSELSIKKVSKEAQGNIGIVHQLFIKERELLSKLIHEKELFYKEALNSAFRMNQEDNNGR